MIAMETAQRKTAIEQLRWDQVCILSATKFNLIHKVACKQLRSDQRYRLVPGCGQFLRCAKAEAINSYVLRPANKPL